MGSETKDERTEIDTVEARSVELVPVELVAVCAIRLRIINELSGAVETLTDAAERRDRAHQNELAHTWDKVRAAESKLESQSATIATQAERIKELEGKLETETVRANTAAAKLSAIKPSPLASQTHHTP